MTLEQLKHPPIVEVVCGFVFEPLSGLDPLLVGTYWNQRRQDYPKGQLQPPVTDDQPSGLMIHEGVGDLRSWLISEDEAFLIQIQSNRFYLNWRKRGGDYPRFSDHHGEPKGVLSRALTEFEQFTVFCKTSIGQEPSVVRIDLTKIDHLLKGDHWKDSADLARMMPKLAPLMELSKTNDPIVAIRFHEDRARGKLLVAIDSVGFNIPSENPKRGIKLETRFANIQSMDPRSDFEWANAELNNVFDLLIPKEQRDLRFAR